MTFWIIKNFLGTSALLEETPKGAIIVDVRDLEDGWNEPEKIKKKIEVIIQCLNTGQPVIIRCQAGMGRSNALAVASLCQMNGKCWEENEKLVKRKVQRTYINADLRKCCKEAVKEEYKDVAGKTMS